MLCINRYPTSLDRTVQELLEGEEDEGVRGKIQDFLNLSVLSVKHQHLSDIEGTLTLSLNHRTPSIRVSALQHLLKNADKVRNMGLYVVSRSQNTVKHGYSEVSVTIDFDLL